MNALKLGIRRAKDDTLSQSTSGMFPRKKVEIFSRNQEFSSIRGCGVSGDLRQCLGIPRPSEILPRKPPSTSMNREFLLASEVEGSSGRPACTTLLTMSPVPTRGHGSTYSHGSAVGKAEKRLL